MKRVGRGWDNIRIVSTPEEREQLYRFRYRIYVEEMGRIQYDADHERKRIEDSLDATAINLAAYEAGEVRGIFRVNLSQQKGLGLYEEFYQMDECGGDHPNHTAIATRFMVEKSLRKSDLALQLCVAAYEVGLTSGTRWCFMDCNDYLVRFFECLGFIEYAPPRTHKEYGEVHRMRLQLEDEKHLRRINSPFLTSLIMWREQQETTLSIQLMPGCTAIGIPTTIVKNENVTSDTKGAYV